MKLSKQAVVVLMTALQKSLMEQSNIIPVIEGWEFEETDLGLVITNPPTKIGVKEEEEE